MNEGANICELYVSLTNRSAYHFFTLKMYFFMSFDKINFTIGKFFIDFKMLLKIKKKLTQQDWKSCINVCADTPILRYVVPKNHKLLCILPCCDNFA